MHVALCTVACLIFVRASPPRHRTRPSSSPRRQNYMARATLAYDQRSTPSPPPKACSVALSSSRHEVLRVFAHGHDQKKVDLMSPENVLVRPISPALLVASMWPSTYRTAKASQCPDSSAVRVWRVECGVWSVELRREQRRVIEVTVPRSTSREQQMILAALRRFGASFRCMRMGRSLLKHLHDRRQT